MSAGVLALQVALGLGMVGLAVSVLFLRDLMASAVALAGFSLLLALEFYVLQAPDVAIAEAGIGAGLTTAIFMVAIRAVSAKGKKKVAPAVPATSPLGGAASSRAPEKTKEPEQPHPVDAPVAEEARQDAAPPRETEPESAPQAQTMDAPVAEERQDAAPPEAASPAPGVPVVPEVPNVPETPTVPENPTPVPPEKEAP